MASKDVLIRRAAVSACLLTLAGVVSADQWYVEPEVGVQTFYDDNIGLERVDETSSAGVSARAAVTAGQRTEITNIGIESRIDSREYFEDSERSHTDFHFLLDSSRQFERNSLGFGATYDYDSTMTSELETTGLVDANKRRRAWSVNPSWTHNFNERTAITTGAAYFDAEYIDAEDTSLSDYDYTTGYLSVDYGWDERTRLLGRVEYSDYQPDRGIDSQTWGLLGGFSRNFSEIWSASLQLGVRQTDVGDETETGQLSDLLIARRSETGVMTLLASRSLSPNGSGELLETLAVEFDWEQPITERLEFLLFAEARRNEVSVASNRSSGDRDYFVVRPRLAYRLDRDLRLVGGYRYRYQKYDNNPDSADSNMIFANLVYRPRSEK